MKTKQTPILNLYRKCKQNNSLLGKDGLCDLLYFHFYQDWHSNFAGKFFHIMSPSLYDELELKRECKNIPYWGSGSLEPRCGVLTPLRETLLLLFAAYLGELDN